MSTTGAGEPRRAAFWASYAEVSAETSEAAEVSGLAAGVAESDASVAIFSRSEKRNALRPRPFSESGAAV